MNRLLDEIREELIIELVASGADFDSLSDGDVLLLVTKVKSAYRDVKRARNYQNHHDDKFITKDMESQYSIIKTLALYDFNQIGAEGERIHAENGISRTWVNRNSVLNQVTPFGTVL